MIVMFVYSANDKQMGKIRGNILFRMMCGQVVVRFFINNYSETKNILSTKED